MLVRHGYGVLLFDRRGEGESDGDPNAFGWAADKDMNAAVAFLQQRPDVDRNRIGGIGLSVGGETLLQTAAESDGLKAVVADGAGARSVREDLARPGPASGERSRPRSSSPPERCSSPTSAPPPNLKSLVGRIAPRPVFFIYGEHDQPNVRELTPGYYAAAGKPKAIWEVAGASTPAASTPTRASTSGASSGSSTAPCSTTNLFRRAPCVPCVSTANEVDIRPRSARGCAPVQRWCFPDSAPSNRQASTSPLHEGRP